MADGAPGQTPHQAEPSCYNCGQKGHWAIACPEPTREVPAGVEAARAQRQNSGHGNNQAGSHQGKSQRKGPKPIITRYPAPAASGPTITRYPLPPQTQPPYPPAPNPPQYYPQYPAQGQPSYGGYSYPAPGAPYGPPPSQYPQHAPGYYPPYTPPSTQSYPYSAPPSVPGQQYGPRPDQPANRPPTATSYSPTAAPPYGPPAYPSRTNTYPPPASAPGAYPPHPYPPPPTQGHYPPGLISGGIPVPYSHGPAATSAGNSSTMGQKPQGQGQHHNRGKNHSRGGQGKHNNDRKGNRFNNTKHHGQRQKSQHRTQRAGSAVSEQPGSVSSNAHESSIGDHKGPDNHHTADPQSRPHSSASKESELTGLSHGKKRGRLETELAPTEEATAKKARKSMDAADRLIPKASENGESEEDPIEIRLRELGVTGQAKPVETRPGFYPIYKPTAPNQEAREPSLVNEERSTSPNTKAHALQPTEEVQHDQAQLPTKERSPPDLPTQEDVDQKGYPVFRVHPDDQRKGSHKSSESPHEDKASDGSLTPVEAELLGYSSNTKEPTGSSDKREQDTPRRRRPRPPPVGSAYSRRW